MPLTSILHPHTAAVMQDIALEQYSTWKDQHSTTHMGDTIAIIQVSPRCSLRQPTSSLYSKWLFPYLLMLTCWRLQTHFPIKTLFHILGNSYQTYINFHKTHTMATHYGGIGITSVHNPESHDMDSDSQDNYQEDVNDLGYIKHSIPVELKHLNCKMEQLGQTVKDKDNDPMDAIRHLEQKLNQLAITLCPPTEPIGEVLNKYTNSLCNAQKKMSLESSLLQDIPILNGNDSSQLEDWMKDIETASELTGESRTKLAQAKSRGQVRTLISEALTLNKTWEDIKDSLRLKICNSDIHMSISCFFMEIQQREKESLAAYIHCFKRKASRCKFNNDATTIRIFIKGLKCTHFSNKGLWKRTTKSSRLYKGGQKNFKQPSS